MVSKVDIQVMKLAANFAILDECPVGKIPDKWADAAISMIAGVGSHLQGLFGVCRRHFEKTNNHMLFGVYSRIIRIMMRVFSFAISDLRSVVWN
jgi:hypothetical protein